jgi:hypothetical protein
VIGFQDVPRVRDRAAASRLPELAVLSVLAHPTLEDAAPAIAALDALPDDRRQLYLDVIMIAVPEIRQILEGPMKGYQYRSEFAREYYGKGHDEGLAEGQLAGLRTAVTTLVRAKVEEPPEGDLATIETVADPAALTELITALGLADSAADVRAVLDQALGQALGR